MRLKSSRKGVAAVSFCLIQFSAGGAMGADGGSSHTPVYDPACTLDGEAKCWSSKEVGEALDLIFCHDSGSSQPCQKAALSPAPTVAIEEPPAPSPKAIVPSGPKLDASGVPEFNAFEEGCD